MVEVGGGAGGGDVIWIPLPAGAAVDTAEINVDRAGAVNTSITSMVVLALLTS